MPRVDPARTAARNVSTGAAAGVIAFVLAACVSPEAPGRIERHAVGEVWAEALAQELAQPEQLLPEVALLAATPILRHYDQQIQEDAAEHQPITGGSTSRGDAVALALGAASAGWAGWKLVAGDQGESLEVGVESLLATEGATALCKSLAGRSRPTGSSTASFPSGHASLSFAAATFLARSLEEEGDAWYDRLGYAFYLPAAYVAIDRVEADRHFASDVAFGAFLGTFLTNTIFNAHYGDSHTSRSAIYGVPISQVSLAPMIDVGTLGLAFTIGF